MLLGLKQLSRRSGISCANHVFTRGSVEHCGPGQHRTGPLVIILPILSIK